MFPLKPLFASFRVLLVHLGNLRHEEDAVDAAHGHDDGHRQSENTFEYLQYRLDDRIEIDICQ